MITDAAALEEIQRSWTGAESLRGKVQRALLGSFSEGASFVIFAADAAHNLPFMHSYAVLSDVLLQLAREGRFECKNIFLGKLLSESETQLRWINFRLIKEGADRRNDVAHRGEVLPRGDCWRYMDAIKEQLVAWKIVPAS